MKKDRPVSKGVKPKGDSVTTQQEPVEWSVEGFIDEFFKINSQMLDRSFLFILGSGASISSGIPGAAALADRWLKELYDLEGGSGQPIEVWAAGILHSTDFQMENIAEFYPVIFESRFRNDPERGYADLENVMSQARPNVGYSVLAQILAKTRHKVLLTTNFDNLVEQSLFQYSDTFPLVCGHESLAGFARPKLRRPLVAKIHRDLLLEPQNAPAQISQLDPKWRTVLGKLLKEYCPLVIGYGGNDGSLMGFLENLLPGEIQTRLSWCYHRGSQPSKRIKDLVSKHDGRLIPILGFDEFMIQLNQKFYWPMLIEDMEAKSKSRVETYRLNFEKFSKMVEAVEGGDRQKSMEPVKRAVRDTVDRDQSWFSWFLKARRETDPKKAEQIYKDGIDKNPRSAQLFGSFAVFMYKIRKEYDEAERLYKKALELDPGNANNTGNYALFMHEIRKEYDEAEGLYKKALELDPGNANTTGNYSELLLTQGRFDECLEYFRRAWKLNGSGNNQLTGVFLFFWCLVNRFIGSNDSPGLSRLKWLLNTDFERPDWNFDQVLAFTKTRISPDEFAFYADVAKAILAPDKTEALNKYEAWKKLKPVDIKEPWELSV